MSLNIVGDKNNFVSKNAIVRLKNDIKNIAYTDIEDDKYLNPGFKFSFDNNFNLNTSNNNVNIITKEDLTQENNLIEARQKLKKMLKTSKEQRSNAGKQKIQALKRSIPKKIFDSYTSLMKNYKIDNILAPDDVINNVAKYRMQISVIMGKKEHLSNDVKMSNQIKSYYNILGNYLDIEPLIQGANMQYNSNPTISREIIQEPNTNSI